MSKIKNTKVYTKENEPTLSDFLVGTKDSNGKTKSFSLEAILQLLNSSNGVNNIQFKFSNGSHPTIDFLSAGYFFTDTNTTEVGTFTELIFNKETIQPLDLSPLFNKLGELENVVIKLENPEDPNVFFNFKVVSFTDNTDYFTFEIEEYNDLYLGELINEQIYSFYFDIKTAGDVVDISGKLDKDGYTGTAQDIVDNAVQKIESQDFIVDYGATTIIEQINLTDYRSSLSLTNAVTDIKSIQQSSEFLRPGKLFFIKNRTGHNVTIWHDSGTGNVKFSFPNNLNLVVKNKEVIEFSLNGNDSSDYKCELVGHEYIQINEIDDSVINFLKLKNWVNSKLSSLSVDLTDAINGSKTVCIFNSATNPFFYLIEGINGVSGEWVANKDLLLEFEYFNNEVYLVVNEIATIFDPINLASLQMFLDASNSSTMTIGAGNILSSWSDLTIHNNDFVNSGGTDRPLLKRNSIFFDGVNDKFTLSAASSSFKTNTQGELVLLVSKKNKDIFSQPFSLFNNAALDDYLLFNFTNGVNLNRLRIRQKGTGSDIDIFEGSTFKKYENLDFNIYNIVSNGTSTSIYRNGINVGISVTLGADSGFWFGDKSSINNIAIQYSDRLATPAYWGGELKSIQIFNTPLTTTERNDNIAYLKNKYFGMINPLNMSMQTLTADVDQNNGRYNFTGGIIKDPTTANKLVSYYNRGDTHYLDNILMDVVLRVSADNGLTYGAEKVVCLGGSNISFNNPCIGYSSTGRLCAIYTRVNHTTAPPQVHEGIFYKYSDDDGTTWSTEVALSGITLTDFNAGNSVMVTGGDGYLYQTFNENNWAGNVKLNCIRSADNGVTWSIYSTIDSGVYASYPINETTLSYLGGSNILAITRIQSRNYYIQYLSTNNGLTWTKQGETNLGDWWTDETTGVSSFSVHQIRTETFEIEGVKIVAAIYLNRGVNYNLSDPSFMRVVFGRAQDFIDYGINGWQDGCGVKFNVSGITLDRYDGYPTIIFPNNDNNAIIRNFHDYTGSSQTDTRVQYFNYEFDLNWLKAILKI